MTRFVLVFVCSLAALAAAGTAAEPTDENPQAAKRGTFVSEPREAQTDLPQIPPGLNPAQLRAINEIKGQGAKKKDVLERMEQRIQALEIEVQQLKLGQPLPATPFPRADSYPPTAPPAYRAPGNSSVNPGTAPAYPVPYHVPRNPDDKPQTVTPPPIPPIPNHWQRLEINGQVFFVIPAAEARPQWPTLPPAPSTYAPPTPSTYAPPTLDPTPAPPAVPPPVPNQTFRLIPNSAPDINVR